MSHHRVQTTDDGNQSVGKKLSDSRPVLEVKPTELSDGLSNMVAERGQSALKFNLKLVLYDEI